MSDNQSRFVLFLQEGASQSNNEPNLTGEFRLAGEAQTIRLKLWAKQSDAGKTYATGTAVPAGIGAALAMAAEAPAEVDTPPRISLEVGRAVLFPGNKDGNPNGPDWHGYARTPKGYVHLAGWEKNGGSMIAGSAEPYRPGQVREPIVIVPDRNL